MFFVLNGDRVDLVGHSSSHLFVEFDADTSKIWPFYSTLKPGLEGDHHQQETFTKRPPTSWVTFYSCFVLLDGDDLGLAVHQFIQAVAYRN